jgi:hypothetical protein
LIGRIALIWAMMFRFCRRSLEEAVNEVRNRGATVREREPEPGGATTLDLFDMQTMFEIRKLSVDVTLARVRSQLRNDALTMQFRAAEDLRFDTVELARGGLEKGVEIIPVRQINNCCPAIRPGSSWNNHVLWFLTHRLDTEGAYNTQQNMAWPVFL